MANGANCFVDPEVEKRLAYISDEETIDIDSLPYCLENDEVDLDEFLGSGKDPHSAFEVIEFAMEKLKSRKAAA